LKRQPIADPKGLAREERLSCLFKRPVLSGKGRSATIQAVETFIDVIEYALNDAHVMARGGVRWPLSDMLCGNEKICPGRVMRQKVIAGPGEDVTHFVPLYEVGSITPDFLSPDKMTVRLVNMAWPFSIERTGTVSNVSPCVV